MNIFGKDLQNLVEDVLKWGTLAYAFGFFTVMCHTSRLGIPIIQLADPVYVLIGAPMAIYLFFIFKNYFKIKSRMDEFMQELEETRTRLTTDLQTRLEDFKDSKEAKNYLLELLTEAVSVLLPTAGIRRLVNYSIVHILMINTIINSKIPIEKLFASVERKINFVTNTYKVIVKKVFHLKIIFSFVILPIVLSFFYINYGYPMIPQTYGGGKSVEVQLILDCKRIPQNEKEMQKIFKIHDEESVVTNIVSLLYTTNDVIYVRAKEIVAKRDFPDNLVKTLLNNEIFTNIDAAPDYASFNNSIKDEKQLEDSLNNLSKLKDSSKNLSEEEIKRIKNIWRQIHKRTTFSFNRDVVNGIIWAPDQPEVQDCKYKKLCSEVLGTVANMTSK